MNHIKSHNIHSGVVQHVAEEGGKSDFFADIVRAGIYDRILDAVESLPEQRGVVFRMAFFDGHTNEEIALSLGLSVNTVKSQKNKAKLQLRTRLKGLCPIAAILLCPGS